MISVAFRYEGTTAQIILTPTSNGEEAQLKMCQQYLTKNISVKLESEKSLVIQFGPEPINGATE